MLIEKLSGIDFVSYADKNLLSQLGIKNYLWNTDSHNQSININSNYPLWYFIYGLN